MPAEVASERLQRLVETVRTAARQRNLGLLGTRHEVLVEREAKRGEAMLMTRTRDFKTVLVPGDGSMLGQYLTVELTGTTGLDVHRRHRARAATAAHGLRAVHRQRRRARRVTLPRTPRDAR